MASDVLHFTTVPQLFTVVSQRFKTVSRSFRDLFTRSKNSLGILTFCVSRPLHFQGRFTTSGLTIVSQGPRGLLVCFAAVSRTSHNVSRPFRKCCGPRSYGPPWYLTFCVSRPLHNFSRSFHNVSRSFHNGSQPFHNVS